MVVCYVFGSGLPSFLFIPLRYFRCVDTLPLAHPRVIVFCLLVKVGEAAVLE